jgi:hypothetical protein
MELDKQQEQAKKAHRLKALQEKLAAKQNGKKKGKGRKGKKKR